MIKDAFRAIIENKQCEVLLVKRAGGIEVNKYCLPGGKVDDGESDDDAIIREINEELTILRERSQGQ